MTLYGIVDTYSVKLTAEKLPKKYLVAYDKTDTEIAEAVVNALQWRTPVQEEKIKIKVGNGVVTPDGEVGWDFQRTNAKQPLKT